MVASAARAPSRVDPGAGMSVDLTAGIFYAEDAPAGRDRLPLDPIYWRLRALRDDLVAAIPCNGDPGPLLPASCGACPRCMARRQLQEAIAVVIDLSLHEDREADA